jgi:hypothetical protein
MTAASHESTTNPEPDPMGEVRRIRRLSFGDLAAIMGYESLEIAVPEDLIRSYDRHIEQAEFAMQAYMSTRAKSA